MARVAKCAVLLLLFAACGPDRGCIQAGAEVNCNYDRCGVNGVKVWGVLDVPYEQERIRLRVEWCEEERCGATELEARLGPERRVQILPLLDGSVVEDAGTIARDGGIPADSAGIIRGDDLDAFVEVADVECGAAVACPVDDSDRSWKLRLIAHPVPFERTERPASFPYRLIVTDLDTHSVLVDLEAVAEWTRDRPQGCPEDSNTEHVMCWHAYRQFELVDPEDR